MKLNVTNTSPAREVAVDLGISQERETELKKLVAGYLEEMAAKRPMTSVVHEYYALIAGQCNTLEEYTTCLHFFIFTLARRGTLRNERSFTN